VCPAFAPLGASCSLAVKPPVYLPSAFRLSGDLASTVLRVHQVTSLTPGLNTTHPQPHTSPTAALEHHRAHIRDRNHKHVLNERLLHHCRFLPVRSRVGTRQAPKQERTPGSNTQDKASASELSSGHHVRAAAREFTPRFGRCSHGLFPSRVISVKARCATHSPRALRLVVAHHTVLQGIDRTSLGTTLARGSNPHGVSYLVWLRRRHPSLARWLRSPPSRKRLFGTCPLSIPLLSIGNASRHCNQCR